MIEVLANAKINLTLEVLGRRADGFHDLCSVVARIGLADRITIEERPGRDVELSVTGAALNMSAMCPAEKNLAYRAAMALGGGVSIRIYKSIHLGAGLGGGSADAAAVLTALGARRGFAPAELIALAATLGSDIPSLTLGGTVLMEGRGEKVSPFPAPAARLPVVIAMPRNAFCPTAEVYKKFSLQKSLHKSSKILYNIQHAFSGSATDVAMACMNDLGAAAAQVAPPVGQLVEQMRSAGALNPVVSGSGAAVYAVCSSPDEAAALANSVGGLATEIVR